MTATGLARQSWVRRISSVAGPAYRRARDWFPLTLLGCLVLLLGLLTWSVWAAESMDVVLKLVGLGALLLVGVALLLVVPTALALKLRKMPAWPGDLSLETGVPVATGVRLPWLGWVPLVTVRFSWLEPEHVSVAPKRRWTQVREVVIPQDRGVHKTLLRRVVVQDVLGLAQLGIRWRQDVSMTILPRLAGLSRLRFLRSFAGGDEWPHPMGLDDGDRVELRRYVPGDPARFIHWKIFGRTRRLMVRMPERALSRADRSAAYLIAGPLDDASAAAARIALEDGSLGVDWAFGADGTDRPARTLPEAMAALIGSAAAPRKGGEGLSAFIRQCEERGPTSLVVFAPPLDGPWVDQVLALLRQRPQGLRVVLALDQLLGKAENAGYLEWLGRALFHRKRESKGVVSVERAALARLEQRLARPMLELLVVNRTTGHIVSQSHALSKAQSHAQSPGQRVQGKRGQRTSRGNSSVAPASVVEASGG